MSLNLSYLSWSEWKENCIESDDNSKLIMRGKQRKIGGFYFVWKWKFYKLKKNKFPYFRRKNY